MPDAAAELLGDHGPLASRLPGFRARAEQQAMAAAVAETLADGGVLVAEAGTGTGKTFAYLVPALLSGRKVIVSTGTKTLQDQLFHKDLPLVREALGVSARIGLLKGRANYLCLYRLEAALEDGRYDSPEQASALQAVREWSLLTRSGDFAEGPPVLRDPQLHARVSSTAENCLGQECPLYAECFLMEARRRAQEADVLVVNHHLLMADWAVREGGFGEVLPAADAYVLDEAHQLAETAAQFFGLSVGSRQIADLVRDVRQEYFRDAGDMPALLEAADDLTRAAADLRLALGSGSRRAAWVEVAERADVAESIRRLSVRLEGLEAALEALAPRGKGLEHCWKRAARLHGTLVEFLFGETGESVQWFETYTQSFLLRITPLDVAEQFRAHMGAQGAAWVFTSATLSVGKGFEHFLAGLGIEEARTLRLESPFDYASNTLLYVPRGLPRPNLPDYDEAFLEAALPVLEASRGRAFLLFTSYRALQFAADWLASRLEYPLLVQGEAAQNVLLERFRALGDAVLLGTASFWEGVDVRGEALSCVIIDRLPFASPSDPVLQARIDALQRREGNPFLEHQLPLAVIALRQGVGRLIRDAEDRGVLMIGDHRLLHMPYGKVFLESLPAMPLSRDLDDVRAFFAAVEA